MAESTINIGLSIGTYTEVTLEIEVDWRLSETGELMINDFYAYYMATSPTGHVSYERIPYWLHKLVEVELEEYHEDIVNKMD